MKVYILLNLTNSENTVMGVYDSELLATKRKIHFEISFPENEFHVIQKNMEYIDKE